jgi:hypothetical protein
VRRQNDTSPLEDNLAMSFIKLNILLPYDPVIALLGLYPEKLRIKSTPKTACRYV